MDDRSQYSCVGTHGAVISPLETSTPGEPDDLRPAAGHRIGAYASGIVLDIAAWLGFHRRVCRPRGLHAFRVDGHANLGGGLVDGLGPDQPSTPPSLPRPPALAGPGVWDRRVSAFRDPLVHADVGYTSGHGRSIRVRTRRPTVPVRARSYGRQGRRQRTWSTLRPTAARRPAPIVRSGTLLCEAS